MGGMVTSAEHGMTGALVKRSAIPHTLSFATRLGALLRHHDGHIDAIEPELFALFEASDYGVIKRLFTGKVIDTTRKIVGGYDVGTATVQSFEDAGRRMELLIKNEYLVGSINGRTVASVPDLICIVEQETARPLNAERMRYGQRIAVFGIGCTQHYRTAQALSVTEPRAFGFDLDYIPLEDIDFP
jgi:DUF917 family protein